MKEQIKQVYDNFKRKHDAVILFREGDEYIAFFEDAKVLAQLTNAEVHRIMGVTFSGFAYHKLDWMLPKIIRAGHRVAICDQVSDYIKK